MQTIRTTENAESFFAALAETGSVTSACRSASSVKDVDRKRQGVLCCWSLHQCSYDGVHGDIGQVLRQRFRE